MWIEIFDTKEGSRIIPLDRKRLSVGSGEINDIVINDPGVSRKHLMISLESGVCYVMDMGSTNGTFVNDAKLEHGKKIQMTTFFPLRLGKDVIVSLHEDEPVSRISEDDTKSFEIDLFDDVDSELEEIDKILSNPKINLDAMKAQESTRVISLKDLMETKTETLVKKRDQIQVKKKITPKEKPKRKITFADVVGGIAVLVMIYFGYEKLVLSGEEVVDEADPLEQRISERRRAAVEKKREVAAVAIPAEELLPSAEVLALKEGTMCSTPEEQMFCHKEMLSNEEGFGAVQTGTKMVIFVDSFQIFNEAKILLSLYSQNPPPIDIYKTVFALYFNSHFPEDLNFDLYKDTIFTFAFFERPDPSAPVPGAEPTTPTLSPDTVVIPPDPKSFSPELRFIAAVKGEKLMEMKKSFTKEAIEGVNKIGSSALSFADQYYVVY